MTPSEFKAWFDGFTEAFTGVPTKAQWTRVKERVAEIDGKPVTERVFVDRYWPTYIPTYPSYPSYPRRFWSDAITCGATSNMSATSVAYQQNHLAMMSSPHPEGFDSSKAMLELGRADAQALAQA